MEALVFYVTAAIVLFAALRVVTGKNAVHALLFEVVALLALALVFVLYAVSFAAALQIIVFAGAIVVLIIFVIMMLNLGSAAERQEREWLAPSMWRWPALLGVALVSELLLLLPRLPAPVGGSDVNAVGLAMYGPYLVVVEAASLLLLAGLVAAWHIGRTRDGGP